MNATIRGLLVALAAVGAFAGAGLYFMSSEQGAVREAAENDAAAVTIHAAEEVSTRLSAFLDARKSSAGAMGDYFKNLPVEMRGDRMQLKLLASKYKDFDSLFVVDEAGKLLSTNAPESAGLGQRKWADLDEFKKAQKAGQPAAGRAAPHEGGASAYVLAPLPGPKGFGGVIGGIGELFKLKELGRDLEKSPGSHLFVSTDDGKLLGMVTADGLSRDAGVLPPSLWQSVAGSGVKFSSKARAHFTENDKEHLVLSVPVTEGGMSVVAEVLLTSAGGAGPGGAHVIKAAMVGLLLAVIVVFALGRLKGAESAGGGGDPATASELASAREELKRMQKERDNGQSDMERLREQAMQSSQRAESASRELQEAKQQLEASRQETQGARQEANAARQDALSAQQDMETAKLEAQTAQAQAASAAAVPESSAEADHELARSTEVDRIKTDAIYTVSKEMSGSFTIIKNFIYKLLTASKDKEMEHAAQEFLDKLVATTAPLERLMEDLVSFSQLSTEHKELDLQRVDVSTLLHRIVAETKPLADAKRLQVQVTIEKAAGEIECDPTLIGMVLTNLMKNAIKFTPKEGRIGIDAHPNERGVLIAVKDTGKKVGLAANSKVFLQFEGTNTSLTKKIAGTGLRMPIMQSAIEAHGGRLWIDHSGEFNRFAFLLPRTPNAKPRKKPS